MIFSRDNTHLDRIDINKINKAVFKNAIILLDFFTIPCVLHYKKHRIHYLLYDGAADTFTC